MAVIALADVWKFYGNFPALREVEFALEPGYCCALLGRNGAGKTTLLRVLGGLSPFQRGSVQVLGSKVAIQGYVSSGSVEDIVFDDAGNLEYLIIANEGKLVTVPWEAAAKFNFDQRVATVNITADQYKSIPTYTTTTYPEFYSPVYRTQIYKSYGLTPRDLRRLERRGVIP